MQKLHLVLIGSLATIALASTSTFARVGFNPSQLEQFETTNKCESCDLSSTSLSSYNHSGAVLTNSDLSLLDANVNAVNGLNLSNSSLKGANFSSGYIPNGNFTQSEMENANMSSAFLIGDNFSQAKLQGVNFSGANLGNANLSQADLTNANLNGANLSRANLSGAKNADLSKAGNICDTILPDGTTNHC